MLGRPSALDRVIDAIPAHDLLTRSPFDLIDPARAAAAGHLEQIRIPVWIVMIALQIAVLAWFWSTGSSARLRDRLRTNIRSEFAVRFWFAAVLTLLDKSVALVPQAVQYRFSRIMDVTDMLFRTWLLDWIVGTIIAMLAAGLIAAIVLWLVDRTHQWYLYTIAGVIGVTLLVTYVSPYVIAPAYSRYTPLVLSGKPASDNVALQARTSIHVPILEEHLSGRTRLGHAYIIGWGGSQRIVISDTMLAAATEGELRFVLARSYAWIAANTGLHLALIQGAMIVLGTALAVFMSDRIGFRRDDDPVARLALLGAILGCVYVIALPFYNGYTRNLDLTSDKGGVALTGDPASAIRLVVRQTDEALVPVCPNPFAYWYLYPHPSPGQRIAELQGRSDPCLMPRR